MTSLTRWGADVVTRRLIALLAVLTGAGCSLDKQAAPPLTGPSELGLSLGVTATPDVITQDGQSTATITIKALNEIGLPKAGVGFRAATYVGGTAVDFGVLSAKVGQTGSNGEATLTYRSPAAPPPSVTADTLVVVAVTPIGDDYSTALARQVQIRLARPGVILPPNGTPVPKFFFSPTSPREDDDVFFDASGSSDSDGSITSYAWSFGDGRTDTSSGPTMRHHYDLAGAYSVTLTVTDDRGQTATSAPQTVTIASVTSPTAAFTMSPTSPVRGVDVVNFNASLSKPAPGRTIVNYSFDFGDGSPLTSSAGPTAQHLYGSEGAYVVVLKVTDDTGRVGAVSQNLTVKLPTP
jgi:PKD repeat protein